MLQTQTVLIENQRFVKLLSKCTMATARVCCRTILGIETSLSASALIDRESSIIGSALVVLLLKGLVRFEARRMRSSAQKGHLRRDDEIKSDAQSESICESRATSPSAVSNCSKDGLKLRTELPYRFIYKALMRLIETAQTAHHH